MRDDSMQPIKRWGNSPSQVKVRRKRRCTIFHGEREATMEKPAVTGAVWLCMDRVFLASPPCVARNFSAAMKVYVYG